MLVRLLNAKVKAVADYTKTPVLTLYISGAYDGRTYEFIHAFSAQSRESRLLMQTDIQTINKLFDGGSYLFIDGVMRDYRGSSYKGYQHGDEAIKALIERLGYSQVDINKPRENSMFSSVRNGLNGAFLGGKFDSFDLEIPNMGDGGQFTNTLVAGWSPFRNTVTMNVDMLRLICTNGMVGEAPALTYEVPIVNDWKNSLDIASRQLKPRINGVMKDSLERMVDERATIGDLKKVQDLLVRRHLGEKPDAEFLAKIQYLLKLTNIQHHLGNFYTKEEMGLEQNLAHLTRYDVFNVLTETSSHIGRDGRNDRAIGAFLNEYMFASERQVAVSTGIIKLSEESDHQRAFFSSYNGK